MALNQRGYKDPTRESGVVVWSWTGDRLLGRPQPIKTVMIAMASSA